MHLFKLIQPGVRRALRRRDWTFVVEDCSGLKIWKVEQSNGDGDGKGRREGRAMLPGNSCTILCA